MAVKTTPPGEAGKARGTGRPEGRRTWPYRTTLPNGTPIAIRPLAPDDEPKLDAIVTQLSPLSRYFRYLTPLDRLPRQQLHELCAVDDRDHLAVIAEVEEDGVSRAVGVARSVRMGPGGGIAEVAAEVVDEWQRCGVGTLMLTVLASCARCVGIKRWHAVMYAQNVGIQKAIGAVADLVSQRQVGYGLIEAIYDLHED